MKIKKNGVTLNLTENDIKKISVSLLKEQTNLGTYLDNADDCDKIKACLKELIGGSPLPSLSYAEMKTCMSQANDMRERQ